MYDTTETQAVTDSQIESALYALLLDKSYDAEWSDMGPGYGGVDELPPIVGVATFNDRGLLTYNKGVVVELEDGSEFQIQIVKSR